MTLTLSKIMIGEGDLGEGLEDQEEDLCGEGQEDDPDLVEDLWVEEEEEV